MNIALLLTIIVVAVAGLMALGLRCSSGSNPDTELLIKLLSKIQSQSKRES